MLYGQRDTLRDSQLDGTDTTLILDTSSFGTPCINVADFENGKVKPKESKDNGLDLPLQRDLEAARRLMFYATWSKGFRPGGINRQPGLVGLRSRLPDQLRAGLENLLRAAAMEWRGLSPDMEEVPVQLPRRNSLTVVQNGRDAKINGIETDVSYAAAACR